MKKKSERYDIASVVSTEKNIMQELDCEDEIEIRRQLSRFKILYKIRTGRKPDEKLVEKEKEKIIKKYTSADQDILHQSEKEDGQLDCLLKLLQHEKKHLSIEEMSQCLIDSGYNVGSSVKTIYRRILPLLIDRGALKDNNKKYYIPEYRRSPDVAKRIAEDMTDRMETVSIISNFLETIKDTPVYEKAKKYIDSEFRIQRHRISRNEKNNSKYKEDAFVSRVIFMGAPAVNIESNFWKTIHSAMTENMYIQIQYVAEERSKPEKYTIKPYQLIFDNGFWDLWGECTTFDHRGTKLFNLSRITEVQVIDKNKKFELPENYDFRNTLAGCFGCYNDNVIENYSIKIKKDSYAYFYIKDRIWGEFQEIKKVKGGFILEFEASQYKPILRWVLSRGPDVEPLEPEKLVEDWKEKIREMYNKL